MKYQVQQNGKPADCHNFPTDESWNNATFSKLEDAQSYFDCWFSPYVHHSSIELNRHFRYGVDETAAIVEIAE